MLHKGDGGEVVGAIHRDFIGGWRALGQDPIRIGGPTAGLIGVELLSIAALRAAWTPSWFDLAVVILLIGAARVTIGTPLRSALLTRGAKTVGLVPRGARHLPGLWLVLGVTAATSAVAALMVALPLLFMGVTLATRHWYGIGALVGALGVLGGGLAALAVRAAFAWAPLSVVVSGLPGHVALRASLAEASADPLTPLLLVAGRDLLTTLGGTCFAAGALPGYPLADLALLHHKRADPT